MSLFRGAVAVGVFFLIHLLTRYIPPVYHPLACTALIAGLIWTFLSWWCKDEASGMLGFVMGWFGFGLVIADRFGPIGACPASITTSLGLAILFSIRSVDWVRQDFSHDITLLDLMGETGVALLIVGTILGIHFG